MLRCQLHTRPAHRIAALAIACSVVASVPLVGVPAAGAQTAGAASADAVQSQSTHLLDTITVPVDGDTVTSHIFLAPGPYYTLVASGFAAIGPGYFGDAEYAFGPTVATEDKCGGDDIGIAVAPDLAQTGRFYPTFGAYNSKHVYAAGEAVDQIELLQVSYTDCGWNYGGSITLEIYGPNAPEPTPTRKRVAELHVPATGERVETRPLTDGHEYTLVASGTATLNASTGLQADAEYGRTANGHFANDCKLGGVDHDIGVWILAYPKDTTQRFFPIWGAYEKGERYETAWIATSDTNDRLMLAFHECKPADNTGYITVQVYG